jgi:CMP-N,N'-diacetyllegionaminic acid synthase
MNQEIVALILARGGSKRVPRKNLRILGTKPLIAHSIEHAKSAKSVSRIIVSTDDSEIAEVANIYGAEVLDRPAELATDTAKSVDAVVHALGVFAEMGRPADYVVLLQPSSPFRRDSLIDDAFELLMASGCDTVISHYRMDYNHPNRAKRIGENSRISPYCEPELPNVSRAELPIAYYRDGSIYAFRADVPLRFGDLLGDDQRALIVDETINIDTERDWLLAAAEFESGTAIQKQIR